MNKKITNNKIYDVVNEMLTEPYFKSITDITRKTYSPVFDSEKIRKDIEVDENWEYNGKLKALAKDGKEKYTIILNTMNDAYKIIAKDKEKTKNMADIYFSNRNLHMRMSSQIMYLITEDIVKSGFDYTSKEVDDMINKKLDEFIADFYVHYK